MSADIDTLISGYLDETLTHDQSAALEAWINAAPENAERFADAVFLDERLAAELSLKSLTEPVVRDKVVAVKFRSSPQYFARVAALAACVVLGLGAALWWQNAADNSAAASFVSISHVSGVEWRNDQPARVVGDRLAPQVLHLEKGIVHLIFDSGVEVTLEGPAEFEVLSADATRLRSGLLMATVPPGAEGFRVDTPSAQVVDLGTAFGIEQHVDGSSRLSVFEGKVEVISGIDSDKRLLTEGKAIHLGLDGSVNEVAFSSAPFEKLWPAASGIAGSTDNFRIAPPWPRPLRLIQSDTEIAVVAEGHAQHLAEPCPINIAGSEVADFQIPSGQRVRSYLLQFHPTDLEPNASGGKLKRIEGTITFERPVLGLILKSETLKQTDALFSARGGRGPSSPRALKQGPPRLADVVSLSEDRRTLTLKLVVFGRLSDHLRVIVDAALPEITPH